MMGLLLRRLPPSPSFFSSPRLWRPSAPAFLSIRSAFSSSYPPPPPPPPAPAPPPPPPDYLSLSDKALFSQCQMDTFRASGPGGQHRNKTESAVRITHTPTGIVSQAVEDRSQHKNRACALDRLRHLIAIKVRRPLELDDYKPPPELVRILPEGKGQRNGGPKIGPNHPDFVQGMQCLLDLLCATKGSVSYAATLLGISTGALSKVLTSDKTLLQAANEIQASKGNGRALGCTCRTCLRINTGALAKVLTSNKTLLQAVNQLRASKGLKPLR